MSFATMSPEERNKRGVIEFHTKEACAWCFTPTRFRDIDFGVWVCSPECQDALLERFVAALTKRRESHD